MGTLPSKECLAPFPVVLSEIVDHRLGNAKITEVFPGFERPAYLGLARQSI